MRQPIPSVSPLHSLASRPAFVYRVPSLIEELGAIWKWLRNVRPSARERQVADAVVARLAAEMEAAEPGQEQRQAGGER